MSDRYLVSGFGTIVAILLMLLAVVQHNGLFGVEKSTAEATWSGVCAGLVMLANLRLPKGAK